MKKIFYSLCFFVTFLSLYATAQTNGKSQNDIKSLKREQSEIKGIRLKTQAQKGKVLRMEITANGSFTVKGIEFVEKKDVFGEIYNYYKVLQEEIFIEGDIVSLSCNHWELDAIDVSRAPSLEEFYCHDNKPASLDFSHNPQLKKLICSLCDIKALNLSHNTQLKFLDCSENDLSELKLENNKKLRIVSFQSNKIAQVDLGSLAELEEFYCDNNLLTSLDCSNNPKLQVLKCNTNQLTSLTLDNLQNLKELQCAQNRFKNLSINSASLVEFFISDNVLEHISLTAPKLEILVCYGNLLTSLDLSKCPEMNTLSCHTNKFKTLNLSFSPKLEYLWCNNNELEELDFSANPRILSITCYSNSIRQKAMEKLIQTLPAREEAEMATIILVDSKNELEKNECSVKSVNKIKEKQWSVYDYDGGETPYPGVSYEGQSTSNERVHKSSIHLYPNPVTDYLYLHNEINESKEAKLFSEDGNLLLSIPTTNSVEVIDLSTFRSGSYILQVGKESKVILKR